MFIDLRGIKAKINTPNLKDVKLPKTWGKIIENTGHPLQLKDLKYVCTSPPPDIIRQNGKTYVSTGYISRKLIGVNRFWAKEHIFNYRWYMREIRQALSLRSISRRKI